MKRLLLWRHAKTERDNPKGDKARALTDRGREDAALIAGLMRGNGWLPDRVLCSSSVRTRQTWEIAEAILGSAPAREYLDALYLAPWKQILSLVKSAPASARTLLAAGHNPGLEDLAAALARVPETPEERSHLANLREKFPTAAIAVLDFDIGDWNALAPATGTLTAFVAPRFLKELRGHYT